MKSLDIKNIDNLAIKSLSNEELLNTCGGNLSSFFNNLFGNRAHNKRV
ncbi:Uncharacterised protein [Streptococcus pseudoporcinus]|uniref:Bacteriocin n=1 Tax=Streptococcus pseudoporcinus TaxID=361101 RepID=A0A4U9Z888_9STRE|nr:hypothetical protein [Streptococcus pseudoporcinus]VTS35364.1 Uncharacterised protein [Streptococcus pseudoporcinus]